MTLIRPATADDLAAIDGLRKRYGDDLGFVPIDRYEKIVDGTKRNERLLVCTDNDDIIAPELYEKPTQDGELQCLPNSQSQTL